MTHSAENDVLIEAVRAAVVDWNTLGSAKVGLDVSRHIAEAVRPLLAQAWIEGHNHPSPTYAHEDNPYVIPPEVGE